jgi:hypothetical protein
MLAPRELKCRNRTADLWTCYAICNGITTATVTIDDPDANVTATPNNNNAGISLHRQLIARTLEPAPSAI